MNEPEQGAVADAGLKEREHLQEWVIEHPQVLGADVKIVAFEFGRWAARSGALERDRLDVLGLDGEGRLVVVELKRDKAPDTVEMRALKYAALVSRFTREDLNKVHAQFLTRKRGETVSAEAAAAELDDWAPISEESLRLPRVVLMASEFPKTGTATVVFLHQQLGLDVRLLAFQAYRGLAIERAMTLREEAEEVDETTWSTVDQAHTTIGTTQKYALDELDAIAKSLESTKVGELATSAQKAEPEVQKWLGVLAHCFQLHEAADVLELDRRIGHSPEKLDSYRRGMRLDRDNRRKLISKHTDRLLARMDMAVGRANKKMVWTRTRSLAVVESGNHVAVDVHQFNDSLGIEAESRSWEPRHLGPGQDLGSQAIQVGKNAGPYMGSVLAFAGGPALVVKKVQGGQA